GVGRGCVTPNRGHTACLYGHVGAVELPVANVDKATLQDHVGHHSPLPGPESAKRARAAVIVARSLRWPSAARSRAATIRKWTLGYKVQSRWAGRVRTRPVEAVA